MIGLCSKVIGSGAGFICRENIGDAGTGGATLLQTKVTMMHVYINLITYPLLEDGNLKPVPSLITVLAIVVSSPLVAASQKYHDECHTVHT